MQRDWLGTIGLSALCIAATVFGALALFAVSLDLWPLAAGLVLLGLAQIIAFIIYHSRLNSVGYAIDAMMHERRAVEQEYYVNFVQSEAFNSEIAALKQRATRAEQESARQVVERDDKLKAIEHRIQNMAPPPRESRMFPDFSTGINPPPYMPVPTGYDLGRAGYEADSNRHAGKPPFAGFSGGVFGREGIAPERRVARDHLNFLLEPVIDLAINETEHYRARYSMTTTTGNDIGYERLVDNADRSGLRASLDLHVVNQALPLIRKLRAKHPNMRLFVPIGTATLMNEQTLAKIMTLLDDQRDTTPGLVFELAHEMLGHLDERGIMGLAMMARRGVALSLANVEVSGLDMNSLRQLGVKFIGLAASAIESGYGVSPMWTDFVQVARGLQFQIILIDVATSTQAASASQVARFAAGPFFAPPRRVRGFILGEDNIRMRSAA